MKKLNNLELAKIGENAATDYLANNGYTIVCRNFRCKFGEIDIIVEKDQQLIFVEVKTRTHHSMNLALDNIGFRKQKKISQVAYVYTNQNPQFGKHNTRFDAIIAFYHVATQSCEIHHFPDAFLPIL